LARREKKEGKSSRDSPFPSDVDRNREKKRMRDFPYVSPASQKKDCILIWISARGKGKRKEKKRWGVPSSRLTPSARDVKKREKREKTPKKKKKKKREKRTQKKKKKKRGGK